MDNTDWKSIALRLLETKARRADKMTSAEPDYGTGVTDYENYGTGVSEAPVNQGYPGQEGLEGGIQDSYDLDRLQHDMLRYEREDPRFDKKRFSSTLMRNTPGREEKIGVLQRLLAMLQGGR